MRNRVFLAGLLCAAPAFAAEQGPLTVLQVLDLSGQNGDTGKDFLTGAKVYFDYINTHGGVNGRKITHVVADDKGIAENTLALTRQLVAESRPAVLFGYMGADNVDTVLADDRLRPSGLALVGPYSGVGRSRWSNLFPVKAGPADEVRRILRMATSLGISRIGLFHGVDTLGKAARTTVDQELAAKGYAPATRAVFHAAINIGDAAEHMAAKQPQAVILAAPTLASAQFVRELRARLPGTQFFALSSVNHQTMLEFLGPQAAQGVAVTALTPSPYNPVTPVAREYVKHLKQFRDEAVSYASIDGYISARVLVEGLKSAHNGNYLAAFAGLPQIDVGGHVVNLHPKTGATAGFVDVLVFSQQGRLVN